MSDELRDQQAVVCGSTQGIGKAVAIELANRGASVALISRNDESLAGVKSELVRSEHQHHSTWVADFARPESVRRAMTEFLAEYPGADILVNNTGGPPPGLAIDAELDAFAAAFQLHLICNQILVQALVPGMRAAGRGRIVNVISTSVKQPILGLGVSNTIRGAVASWAKTLATELGPDGITVNNVLPGYTRTARLDALIQSKAKGSGRSTDAIMEEMLAEIPARRFCDASEIANAVAFLVSPRSGYINGINLPVDGGRTLCL